jgi:hypothetical protein
MYIVKATFTKYYLTDGDQEEVVLRTRSKKYAEEEAERINKISPWDHAWVEEE